MKNKLYLHLYLTTLNKKILNDTKMDLNTKSKISNTKSCKNGF